MRFESKLWDAEAFTVTPTRSRQGYRADITDPSGGSLAACDTDGAILDHGGTILLQTPVDWNRKRHGPANVHVRIADGSGAELGVGEVVKYGVGPRAKKATVAIKDPQGTEVARLEPRDRKGDELAVTANGSTLMTVSVSEVKAGFMRKARVYTAHVAGAIPDAIRPLVYAVVIRYDGLMEGVTAIAMRD